MILRTAHARIRPPRRIAIGALVGALVLVATITTPAAAYPRPGATERVSVASDGAEANGRSSGRAISADGRHVAFSSASSTLVPGDTNECPEDFSSTPSCRDIFVHDREAGTTERVSVATGGAESNGASFSPAISADGRHVAFASDASNLVSGDTNDSRDIFVRDREAGTTERVSVATGGAESNGTSLFAAISPDGRYVAFSSDASNLVPDDTNDSRDGFVHDREAGTTERVSVAGDGTEGDATSAPFTAPSISADGRYAAFYSEASNLVPGDANEAQDVFVRDRVVGTTERVSVSSGGAEGNANSFQPAITPDGRHVVFASSASNLVPEDTNGTADVFVHDRGAGSTELVSVTSGGAQGNGFSFGPAISADGRHVVFDSLASNLVPGDANGWRDAFVHDRETGTTERVSVGRDGGEGNHISGEAAISADGRHIVFASEASNLIPDDENGATDVFVRDRGPVTGVGALDAQRGGGEFTVSGWATFSGVTVTSADDPEDDGVDPTGAEIVGASITHRPELEGLLLRLRLASLPGPRVGGAPGVLYRWSFTVGDTAYEVRGLRPAATADPPTADSRFALYECALVCTETRSLSGGIGITGAEVRVSVPLEALGAEAGTELTDVEASAALGEAAPGPLVVFDDVALPDASIPVARVELGVAPASAPPADVVFSTQAELVEGRFSGTVDVSSLPPGGHRVWARACLGETCGAQWVEVAL